MTACIIERTEADKATCLRQANEAISLGRYPDAIQILEGAQVRFVESQDLDELLRFVRDQQVKAQRQAFVEETIHSARQLLIEENFEGAVHLLEKAVNQVPSEDLNLLLQQARSKRDGFRRDLQAAIAKGKSLLEEGAIANAREFLSSRPSSYQQSGEFRGLVEEAKTTTIPTPQTENTEAEATKMFASFGIESHGATTIDEEQPSAILVPVETEPVPELVPALREPMPLWRKPLVIAVVALALAAIALIIWWLKPVKPTEAQLIIQVKSGTQLLRGRTPPSRQQGNRDEHWRRHYFDGPCSRIPHRASQPG